VNCAQYGASDVPDNGDENYKKAHEALVLRPSYVFETEGVNQSVNNRAVNKKYSHYK
jgi:hypothetical protein